MMGDVLAAAHRIAGGVLGEIALALASRRGVSRNKLRHWSELLRQAAEELESYGR